MIRSILLCLGIMIMTDLLAQNVGIGTTDPTAQLHTTGTVRFQGLEGNGNRLVAVDADGNLMTSLTGGKNDTSAVINVETCVSSFIKSIVIGGLPDSIISANISVTVNISVEAGYSVGKFGALLEAPNGERLVLFSPNISYGSKIQDAIFTDAGTGILGISAPPYTNYYKPEGGVVFWCSQFTADASSFSSLGGGMINPNGVWKLIIETDGNFGPEPGMFHSWSVNFSPVTINCGVDNYIPKWKNGNLTGISDIVDKNGNVGIGQDNPSRKLHIASYGDVELGLENLGENGHLWTLQSNEPSSGLTTSFQIIDRTEASSRLGIDDAGNVGIGTTEPLQKLHVNGNMYVHNRLGIGATTPITSLSVRSPSTYVADFESSNSVTKLLLSNANKYSHWGIDGFHAFINREATTSFSIQCDEADQLYILSNGNTGIGTTSPTDKLHVNGTTRFDGNSSTTGNSTISGNLGVGIAIPNAKLDVVGNVKISNQAIINGNVGIGVPVPSVKLDVAGDTKVTGNSTTTGNQMINGNLGIGVPTPTKRIQISGSGDQEITIQNTDAGGHNWSLQSNSSAATSTFQIIDRTANQSRIGIDNNGNVGVNTSIPAATLDVNGSIRTTYSGSIVSVNLSAGTQVVNLTIPSLPAGWTFTNTMLVVTNVDGAVGIIQQAKITSLTNIQLNYNALASGNVRFNYVVFKL